MNEYAAELWGTGMDDEFQAMLAAAVATDPAVHITALVNRMDQTQPVDPTDADKTVRVRYWQIRNAIHKLADYWGARSEGEIQLTVQSGMARDGVKSHCGKVEFAIVLLALYCQCAIRARSNNFPSVLDGLCDAHGRGVRNANRLPVGTQVRHLMLTSSSLEKVLPSAADYIPGGSPEVAKLQGLIVVLEQLQERVSCYAAACGADLVASTMRLLTTYPPAGVLGAGDLSDRSG